MQYSCIFYDVEPDELSLDSPIAPNGLNALTLEWPNVEFDSPHFASASDDDGIDSIVVTGTARALRRECDWDGNGNIWRCLDKYG